VRRRANHVEVAASPRSDGLLHRELIAASWAGGSVSDQTVLRPMISAFGNSERNIVRAVTAAERVKGI
jgi:hypothetical protein